MYINSSLRKRVAAWAESAARAIMELFGGKEWNADILGPGYHSFSKWAILTFVLSNLANWTACHRLQTCPNRLASFGEQGWRSGESARLPQMWPGFEMWPSPVPYMGKVCCWFSTLLRGFFSRLSGFPPCTKTNTPNSNSISDARTRQ